jgi:hypothetical protein
MMNCSSLVPLFLEKFAEKVIFLRLLKNVPPSAGRCKLSLQNPAYGGARGAFRLPMGQAISL